MERFLLKDSYNAPVNSKNERKKLNLNSEVAEKVSEE